MKKSATKTMLLVMIAIVSVLMVAQIAKAAGISGTAHDLRSSGSSVYKGSSDQVCIYCHTPHNAQTTPPVVLWNRSYVGTGYTAYTSSTFNATATGPSGVSSACLSCHDGTTAPNAFVGGTAGVTNITGSANIGKDLSNDHPISFTYDSTLVTADTTASGSVGLVVPASASLVVTGIPLFSAKMECASCHSVHDPANGNFLRVSNVGSALCLKCHIK